MKYIITIVFIGVVTLGIAAGVMKVVQVQTTQAQSPTPSPSPSPTPAGAPATGYGTLAPL